MATKFVKIVFDLKCDWEGFPPEYRLFVNDELMTERTYDFSSDYFVREMLQIQAEPGDYVIRLEKVGPQSAEYTISNSHVKLGPAEMIDNMKFRIL